MDIWQQSHLILSARAVTAVARSWLFPTLDLLKCSGTFVLVTVEESYVQVSKQTAALSTAYLSLLSWWLLKGLVRLHGIFIRLYRHGRGLSPGFFFSRAEFIKTNKCGSVVTETSTHREGGVLFPVERRKGSSVDNKHNTFTINIFKSAIDQMYLIWSCRTCSVFQLTAILFSSPWCF